MITYLLLSYFLLVTESPPPPYSRFSEENLNPEGKYYFLNNRHYMYKYWEQKCCHKENSFKKKQNKSQFKWELIFKINLSEKSVTGKKVKVFKTILTNNMQLNIALELQFSGRVIIFLVSNVLLSYVLYVLSLYKFNDLTIQLCTDEHVLY